MDIKSTLANSPNGNYDNFRSFCSQESNSESLKELLAEPSIKQNLNITLLSMGLLSSLENGRNENTAIICAYVLNNNVLFDVPLDNVNDSYGEKIKKKFLKKENINGLYTMFNAATKFKKMKLANLLSQKYSILENAITNKIEEPILLKDGSHKESAELNDDGSLKIMTIKGGSVPPKITEIKEYSLNPILFNLKNFNPQILDGFLNEKYKIDSSVVEHGLVMNVYLNNNEPVLYLFANKRCADIIKSSDKIKAFINSDKEWADKKQISRSALLMINLKDELPENNNQLGKFKL
jgi:hypothetical protein